MLVCEDHVVTALKELQIPHIQMLLPNTRTCNFCENYAVFSLYVSSFWKSPGYKINDCNFQKATKC
ncbi:hypothetical protein [Bacillus sp. SRB_331]|uniref:hypothetical protein n=1 Tax=Bacillus sp. SRB_331 TaxID=1969379 RepID=UPI000DC3F7F0|nr:hypothetical protein [Bacillus sp. SRB_331]RAN80594.1 hypothetical protein B5P42_13690 [Bacillus sp. SRB_331]RAN86768.1 hypothetical protein B5P41_27320 [Bacillus sp. SRB_28]